MKQVFLHIGTHKTGTTSIQTFLDEHRTRLGSVGARFFDGRLIPHNHVELHLSAMRPGRSSPIHVLKNIQVDDRFRRRTHRAVRRFLRRSTEERLLFSAEGLSYLRYADEIAFLRSAFAGYPVRVIVFLRDAQDFLRSYRAQMHKLGFAESDDPESFAYTRADSWLVQWDRMLGVYGQAFGEENLVVRRFEGEIERWGSVVPSFLDGVGSPRTSRTPPGTGTT